MTKQKTKILVVDSDPQTYKILDLILDKDHFEVVSCFSGRQAIRLCVSIKPEIILLELSLSDMESKDVITAIREWSQTPVIIVSSCGANEDVVNGLNSGADDYVIKPFNVDVLLARINASLRKSVTHEAGEPELVNGPLRIDLVRHEVFLDDTLVPFTPKEYSLLRFFIVHRGKMLGHKQILNEVWGAAHGDDTQYLRVFIGQLREKIEKDPANPVIITTELGIGYRMELLETPSNNRQQEMRV